MTTKDDGGPITYVCTEYDRESGARLCRHPPGPDCVLCDAEPADAASTERSKP